MSVLGNKMTDKSYYFHEDSDGKYTYMIAGNFKRDNYNFVVELLLRPSSTNRTLVQREMYVRNVSGSTQEFQVFFGEDTKMGLASSSYADAVPIKDLGNNHGIFIAAGDYKLSITNETEDGFQHYVALSRKTNAPNWADRYDSNGNGDEKRNLNYGETLLDSTDSAYSLSWDKTTLANNQVAHFSSTIGETQSPYSLMHANKTYKNETNNTGKNNINDKLKFTLNITNNGYNANWNYRQLVDKIPEGLQIDPNSIKKSFNNGTEVSINPSDYDASTRTLTVPIAQSLTDNQTEKVTFEANITTDAISHLDSSGNLKTPVNSLVLIKKLPDQRRKQLMPQ
jgi:conserved repeat domain